MIDYDHDSMANDVKKPGDGFLGWLGRQIGHVAKAVNTDVTAPPPPAPSQPAILHREVSVSEHPMPDRPEIVLRRTTIDEAILNPTDSPHDR